jgi:CHASE3 domain sensor protein
MSEKKVVEQIVYLTTESKNSAEAVWSAVALQVVRSNSGRDYHDKARDVAKHAAEIADKCLEEWKKRWG